MKGSIESRLRRLSVGTVAVFAVVLAAFLWVERRLAFNLGLNEEVVVPARQAAVEVDDALSELLVRQSRVSSAESLAQVEAVADRSGPEATLRAVRADVTRVADQLAEAESDTFGDFAPRFEATFERFLEQDAAFFRANWRRLERSAELDAAIRAVERDLKSFLESANGISGKMRFEYGSALRRIRRRLAVQGWSAQVRSDLKREVLASSSRRNMIVGDVLSLASELNRLSGKIGLVQNEDQLRSLYANELVPTRDRLEVALEDLRYETRGEPGIQAIAARLEASLSDLSTRILDRERSGSLISMKADLLSAVRNRAKLQEELARTAGDATQLTQTLVGAAERQSRNFSSELGTAAATARWLLAAAVAVALLGGVFGYRGVRESLSGLRQTNADLTRLKDELTELNAGLEAKVAERTAALDARNQAMRIVLDNVEQGLATLDREGRVESESSARFRSWFGRESAGTGFGEVLSALDRKKGQFFDIGWAEVVEGIMPLEVNLAQLPRQVQVGGRTLQLDFSAVAVEDDVPVRTLVVATDITQQIERDRAEAAEREFAHVFRHLMKDRGSFVDFFEDVDATVRRLADEEGLEDREELFRAIHTLKGNCALFGLERMASLCHEVESGMVEESRGPSRDEIEVVRSVWSQTSHRIRQLLADGADPSIKVRREELDAAIRSVEAAGAPGELVARLRSWHDDPMGARLDRMADQARTLAKRLGKGDVEVITRGQEVRLPKARLAPFWATLAHVVRNAVDHGLETPDARSASGKSPRGTLELSVVERDDTVVISLSDDGAGVDWDKLKAKADARGLPAATRDDLVAVLFTDGVSSRDDVSAVSGRGVGMGAVRAAAERLGARIDVTSAPGEGTTFDFVVPRVALFNPRAPSRTGTLDLAQA